MRFNGDEQKIVVAIADDLPLGLAMNALSVIGVSLGRTLDGIVGPDVVSRDGVTYPGVINTPLPILKCSPEALAAMFQSLRADARFVLTPFSALAQSCRTYDEYEAKLAAQGSPDLKLTGLGLMGPKKDVNKLTGSLPLYR